MLAVVHQRGELGPARPELIGDVSPGLVRGVGVGLQESLADRGGDHGVLALLHVRQGVAHPMNPASLPGRAEHAGDRQAQPVMGVGDHQLDAAQPALDQALDEARPERLGFRRADAEANDLAPTLGVHGDGDYRCDRDDAAAVAHLEIGGVEPQIPPLTLDRPVEEGVDPLVDVLAELGDLALRDAGEAHRLHQLVDPPGRYAADPGFLDHRDERLLGGLARLQERRKVRALAQLGDAQLERSKPRIEAAVAITVAVIEPIACALVPTGTDQTLDIGFHQDLQHGLRHGAQEIAIAALLQQLSQRHSVFGHRVLAGSG